MRATPISLWVMGAKITFVLLTPNLVYPPSLLTEVQ